MSRGKWIWLFPLTYLCHIAEEVWGGEGFAAWFDRVAGFHLTSRALIISNAAGWVAMTIGVLLVSRSSKWRWVLTALGGIVLMNFLLHAAGSIITRSYSPGLVSSGFFWLPLGLYTLVDEWRHAARSTFLKGLIGVAVFHALLLVAANR
jgi:hypothetical protein